MAQKKDRAEAEVPADAPIGDAELAQMGLDELDEASLTESEKVAQAAAEARPTRKKAAGGTGGKGHATAKRGGGDSEHTRSNPIQFTREAIGELKKVVWPTWIQLRQYFLVVLVFVLIMIGIVSLLDLGFGAGILKLFG